MLMPVSYDLSGKAAVVTGGSRGIGRAVAQRLRQSGARVWVLDIAPLEQDGIVSLTADVTKTDQVTAAVVHILARARRLDILVTCAGLLGGYRPFEDHNPDDWRHIVEVNLIGVFEVCSQALPHMRRAAWGRIVTMGSLAGKEGLPNMPVYSAASAGVIAFTKALGKELAETPIRVNCVTPGPTATDLILQLGPEVVESMIAKSPMKRLGSVDEIAELVLWLCSDGCAFSTGAVFDISGGRAAY
jgi:2-dehydro-3-deoxy-L-rhamnonate dehydrogenase (NAD+)